MYRIILFLIGILLMSVGLFFLIIYLNLFTLGYSFFEFVKFISVRFECLIFLIGFLFLILALRKERLNGLLSRYFNKHGRR